jgi:hypothetical protein
MLFKNNEKEHFVKVKEFNGDDDFAAKQRKLDDEYFISHI